MRIVIATYECLTLSCIILLASCYSYVGLYSSDDHLSAALVRLNPIVIFFITDLFAISNQCQQVCLWYTASPWSRKVFPHFKADGHPPNSMKSLVNRLPESIGYNAYFELFKPYIFFLLVKQEKAAVVCDFTNMASPELVL